MSRQRASCWPRCNPSPAPHHGTVLVSADTVALLHVPLWLVHVACLPVCLSACLSVCMSVCLQGMAAFVAPVPGALPLLVKLPTADGGGEVGEGPAPKLVRSSRSIEGY